MIRSLIAATIGGTTAAVHGEIVLGEDLGVSEGVAGSGVPAAGAVPVIAGPRPLVVERRPPDGWEEWTQVESFAGRRPGSSRPSSSTGRRPRRLRPGGAGGRRHRASTTAPCRPRAPGCGCRCYRTGGGGAGNVARRALSVLRSSIPYVSPVENREPAGGGVDGETVAEAKIRGPLQLRSRDRAVTAEDYEHLARPAAPEIARVRCALAGRRRGRRR